MSSATASIAPAVIAIPSKSRWSWSNVMSLPIVVLKTKSHAEPLDEPDVHLDRLARQAERGDADEHRPAAVRQRVEDRALEALHRQLAGDRDPGRPGADDRDPLVARRDLGHDVGDAGRLVPLDEEPLHRPDRERPVDVAAAAGPLARGGADVRAHRGDRDSARATGCSPPRTGPRPRGSGSRGSSSRRGRLPGTRCCTGARTRRRAERGIPDWDRSPRSRRAFLCAGFRGVSGHEGGRSEPAGRIYHPGPERRKARRTGGGRFDARRTRSYAAREGCPVEGRIIAGRGGHRP